MMLLIFPMSKAAVTIFSPVVLFIYSRPDPGKAGSKDPSCCSSPPSTAQSICPSSSTPSSVSQDISPSLSSVSSSAFGSILASHSSDASCTSNIQEGQETASSTLLSSPLTTSSSHDIQLPCSSSTSQTVSDNLSIPSNDFGFYVSKSLTTATILMGLRDRWKPVRKEDFPESFHVRGGVRRRRVIKSHHIEQYPWLAVSHHAEHWGAWCAYCVLLGVSKTGGGHSGTGQTMGKLVTRPLRDFSDLTGKNGSLDKHHQSNYHIMNAARAEEFLARVNCPEEDVTMKLDAAKQKEVSRNRAVLSSIVETVKFAAIQNIPLCGHRDDGRIDHSGTYPANNDGNFRMLLRFRIQSGDTTLQNHLASASSRALYTSKTVQNELLQDMLTLLKKNLSNQINASPFWTIMADETTDRANREQLAIVVRYVGQHSGVYAIHEDPVTLLDAFAELKNTVEEQEPRLSGENLAKIILKITGKLNLDVKNLVAQCYDGAAAMSSQRVGVSARIKEVAPLAFYFHCCMHALNLATSQVNKVDTLRNALGAIESLIGFVTDSAKREQVLHHAQSMEEQKKHKLIKMCHTRFVERHLSVERFCEQLPAIVEALKLMSTWKEDRKASTKATLHLAAISQSDFLVGIVLLKKISGILRPLSQALQEKGADLSKSLVMIDATTDILKQLRNSEPELSLLFKEATEIAAQLDAEISKPRTAKKSVYRANAADEEGTMNCKEYYRINMMIPALDVVLCDMSLRFSSHQRQAFSLSCLLPAIAVKSSWEDVKPAWKQYCSLLEDPAESMAKSEFSVWCAMWSRRTEPLPKTAIEALNECNSVVIPVIHFLLKVSLFLAVIESASS